MAAVTGISHMPGEIPPEIPLPGYTGGRAHGSIVRSVSEALFRPTMTETKTISAADRRGRARLTPGRARTYDIEWKGFYPLFPA